MYSVHVIENATLNKYLELEVGRSLDLVIAPLKELIDTCLNY